MDYLKDFKYNDWYYLRDGDLLPEKVIVNDLIVNNPRRGEFLEDCKKQGLLFESKELAMKARELMLANLPPKDVWILFSEKDGSKEIVNVFAEEDFCEENKRYYEKNYPNIKFTKRWCGIVYRAKAKRFFDDANV